MQTPALHTPADTRIRYYYLEKVLTFHNPRAGSTSGSGLPTFKQTKAEGGEGTIPPLLLQSALGMKVLGLSLCSQYLTLVSQ